MNKSRFKFFYTTLEPTRKIMGIRIHKFKIFRSIILFISISMMNMFIFVKRTANHFRHYKPMFKNFSSHISHWLTFADKYFVISTIIKPSLSRFSSCFCRPKLSAFSTSKRKIFNSLFCRVIIFMRDRMFNFTIGTLNQKMFNPFYIFNSMFHTNNLPYPNELVQHKGD